MSAKTQDEIKTLSIQLLSRLKAEYGINFPPETVHDIAIHLSEKKIYDSIENQIKDLGPNDLIALAMNMKDITDASKRIPKLKIDKKKKTTKH